MLFINNFRAHHYAWCAIGAWLRCVSEAEEKGRYPAPVLVSCYECCGLVLTSTTV